jgi:hypothetical protein
MAVANTLVYYNMAPITPEKVLLYRPMGVYKLITNQLWQRYTLFFAGVGYRI